MHCVLTRSDQPPRSRSDRDCEESARLDGDLRDAVVVHLEMADLGTDNSGRPGRTTHDHAVSAVAAVELVVAVVDVAVRA